VIKPKNEAALAGIVMLKFGSYPIICSEFIIPHNCYSEADIKMFPIAVPIMIV